MIDIREALRNLLSRLTATRAGYLDELDFDVNARLGAPVGASISADIATTDAVADSVLVDTATLYQKATKSITLSLAAPPVTENLFIVTGEVETYILLGYIDVAVTSAGALTLEVGIAGDTAGIIVQTAVAALLIDMLWLDNTPATMKSMPVGGLTRFIANGATIIHTIATAAATAGAITYYCWWRPLSSDGNVVAA